jgi:transposase-like protein
MQMMESATAWKRGAGAPVASLADEVNLERQGKTAEREQLISSDAYAIRLGRQSRPGADLIILKLAVHQVMRTLPADLAKLAHLLAGGDSLTEAARRLGLSRATVHRRVAQLRAAFQDAGLAYGDNGGVA